MSKEASLEHTPESDKYHAWKNMKISQKDPKAIIYCLRDCPADIDMIKCKELQNANRCPMMGNSNTGA